MNCRQARAAATDYIDGELDDESAATLEAHLAVCPGCPPLMAALIGVLADLRELPVVEPTVGWVQATFARAGTSTEGNNP